VRSRARELFLPTILAMSLAGLLAKAGMLTMAFTDYEQEAEPALMLLRDGDLMGFLNALPAYGGSLILRAPSHWHRTSGAAATTHCFA